MILADYALSDILILPEKINGYTPCNTSLIRHKGELLYQTRYVSYSKHFTNKRFNPYMFTSNQHNYDDNGLGYFNSKNVRYNDNVTTEIFYGEGLSTRFRGFEDVRLVEWDGELYSYGTRPDLYHDKYVMCLYNGDGCCVMRSPFGCDIEKNWMAVPNHPRRFIYGFKDNTVIYIDVNESGDVVNIQSVKQNVNKTLSGVRGSTPLIEYQDGYLTMVHKQFYEDNQSWYRHAFIYFDKDFKILKMSNWFFFHNPICEFCIGMIIDEGVLKMTYSQFDAFPSEMCLDLCILNDILNCNIIGYYNVYMNYFENIFTTLYEYGYDQAYKAVANFILLNKQRVVLFDTYINDLDIKKLLKYRYD